MRAPAKELARGSLRARLRVWEREGAGRISLQMYFKFFCSFGFEYCSVRKQKLVNNDFVVCNACG